MAYVFYDTETTGTDTTFDQVLKFAAILTDDDLKERDRFKSVAGYSRMSFQPRVRSSRHG